MVGPARDDGAELRTDLASNLQRLVENLGQLAPYAAEVAVLPSCESEGGAEGSLEYAGLSTIVGPDGSALALAATDGEALLVAEV